MTTVADGLYQYGGMPVGADSLAVGNVYYVCQTGNTTVNADMVQRFKGNKYKNDHSNILHHTITTALAAVVSKRNDYILVQPDSSDYDEDATLTMDDNNVHLLCPAGMGAPVGIARGASIDPNSDAHAITITGRGVEVAGFWIRGYAEKYCISITGTYAATGAYIHHNDIAITSTSSSGTLAGGIVAAEVAGAGTGTVVAYNKVFSNAGTTATIVAGISAGYNSTRFAIIGNHVTVGNGCTMTVGIKNLGSQGLIDSNLIAELGAAAGMTAGTLTAGITIDAASAASNNRIGITDASNAITGGTAINCINNICSLDGGTVAS